MSSLDTKLNIIKFAFGGVQSLWVVGGAARVKIGLMDKEIKDIDIIVPTAYAEQLFERMLEKTSSLDSPWYYNGKTYFSGYKLKFINDDDQNLNFDVDVWTGDVGDYLSKVPTAWDGVAVNIYNGAVLRTAESLGENHLITSRPVVRTEGKSFTYHCARQGLIIEDNRGELIF